MDGVQVLSKETIYDTILPEWCIVAGLFFAFISFVMVAHFLGEGDWGLSLACFIVMLCCMVVCCLGGTESKTKVDYIIYNVTIDNSVSMSEFMDKYEILDQNGKIYTVREKNYDARSK